MNTRRGSGKRFKLRAGIGAETLERRVLLAVSIGTPRVVNVSRMSDQQAEETIAVNPTNTNQIFVAANEQGTSLFGATSADGGATWTGRTFATGPDALPRACCDPSAAFDSFGNLFFAYLGEDSNNAEVLVSTDGGQTFSHVASLPGHADQPTISVGHGSVWVGFQQGLSAGTAPRGPITLKTAGALMYGAAVTGLGQVGKFGAAIPLVGPPGQNVADVAVGPAGQVLVAYQSAGTSNSSIFLKRDPGGLRQHNFGPAILIGTTNVGDALAIPAQPRRTIDAEIGLAYDTSGDAYAGRVYMAYTDRANANTFDTDIFLRFSDDDGLTWSTPVRVNDDATTASQFFPRIAVDPTTGLVGISWYDCRNDTGNPSTGGGTDTTANNEAQVYAAVGTPTATGVDFSSPNFPITAAFSKASASPNLNEFGDYTGLAFDNGILRPAWADNSNSTGDNPNGAGSNTNAYAAAVSVQDSTPLTGRTLLGQFGTVGGRLTIATPSGGTATLSLAGGGTGFVFQDGNAIDLALHNTGPASRVTITTPRSASAVTIGNIVAPSSIASFIASGADLTGTFSAGTSVGRVSLASITGGTLAAAGSISTVQVMNLTGAKVLSGVNLGSDNAIGGTGDAADSYAQGRINTLTATGSVVNSLVAAGFAPADGAFDNAQGTVVGGVASAIRFVNIPHDPDPATRFAAGAFGTVILGKRIRGNMDSRIVILPDAVS
jgi:hypothetical protein